MGDAGEQTKAKPAIASADHEELLNAIDISRAHGISKYIDLPQIVVCGDQSSGKSSCLEAICGLHFPTGDGLCTRFATEYVLRRIVDESVSISIVPDTDRSDEEKIKLLAFKPSTSDLNDFGIIIKEATAAMGIGICPGGLTFAQDRLKIEISGPTQPHLTLVDLPGLFHSQNKDQTAKDKDAVYKLVRDYTSKSRSIVLAVATAKNDLNNQTVLDFVREADKNAERTLGIITKPDTLPKGSPSESSFLTLAQNKDVRFELGWHVLRNRSYEERDTTSEERDRVEARFFSEGVWQTLDSKNKGVSTLRVRLSKVLHDHILAELPSLLKEVDSAIGECETKLKALGSSRATLEEQRFYLMEASHHFTSLISQAVSGNYQDTFFGSSSTESGYLRRLRAVAKSILTEFEREMRMNGHAVELVETVPKHYKHVEGTPRKMTPEGYYKRVEVQMVRNAGTELPGFMNPRIIKDLFLDQSAPWTNIIAKTKAELLFATHTTIAHALEASADDTTISGLLRDIINPHMAVIEGDLDRKVDEILENLRHDPVTLNHYLISKLQKKRQIQARKDLSKRMYEYLSKHAGDPYFGSDAPEFEGRFNAEGLLDALSVVVDEADMNRFAAIEAGNATESYYDVALKNVNDDIAMHAIEARLLKLLSGIFTHQHVMRLDSKSVTLLAGESEESMQDREATKKKLAVLRETKTILHRLDRHKPSGSFTSGTSHWFSRCIGATVAGQVLCETDDDVEVGSTALNAPSISEPVVNELAAEHPANVWLKNARLAADDVPADEPVDSDSDASSDSSITSSEIHEWRIKYDGSYGNKSNKWGKVWGTGRYGPSAR